MHFVGVLCVLAAVVAPPKLDRFRIASQQTVTAGNGVYRLAVEGSYSGPNGGSCGTWTAATGPLHPAGAGVAVIYGGNANQPRTSNTILRSHATNRSYSTGNQLSVDQLCVLATPLLTPIAGGGQTTGYRMAWTLNDGANGPRVEFIQEVVVEGPVDGSESVDNTVIRETHTVRNLGPGPFRFGLRKMWDWQIGSHDGPHFGDCATPAAACDRPMNMTADGTNGTPRYPSTYVINSAPATATCPSPVGSAGANCSGAPPYLVAGTVAPPSSLAIPPTAPELLQFNSWFTLKTDAWQPALTTGASCAGGDTAVAYFYGLTPSSAIVLAPQEERSFTQYVAAAREGCPRIVTSSTPRRDPCCPPWNAAMLEEMLEYHPSAGIAAPYTFKFKPTPQFNNQMQAYVDYLQSLNTAYQAITIHFRINDAGTGSAPTGGPQVGNDYWVTFNQNGSGPVPVPTFFHLGSDSLQVNRWYRIHTGIYLEGGQKFFPDSCANNDVDVRLQVQQRPMSGEQTPVLQFRKDGRIVEVKLR